MLKKKAQRGSYVLTPRMVAWDTTRTQRPTHKIGSKGEGCVRGSSLFRHMGNISAKPSRSHSLSGVWVTQTHLPGGSDKWCLTSRSASLVSFLLMAKSPINPWMQGFPWTVVKNCNLDPRPLLSFHTIINCLEHLCSDPKSKWVAPCRDHRCASYDPLVRQREKW